MKEDKQWDSCNRTIHALSGTQEFSDILDSSYVPATADDKELFRIKQDQMYSVFHKIFQTDTGKTTVREHAAEIDAQRVYAKVNDHYTKFTVSNLKSGDRLTYLTSSRIDDGKWRGKTVGYILNWFENLRLYHESIPISERLSDELHKTLL